MSIPSVRPTPWAPALLSLLSLFGMAATPGAAQSALVVSTSDDGTLGSAPFRDQDLIVQPQSQAAFVGWPSETLSALAGELTGSLHHVFGDVDALHIAPATPAHRGLYISLTSNENSFLDGDVLRATDIGFEVAYSEGSFSTAAGCSDGNVDVDAFHLDPDGRLLFSFAEDEASSTLSGDTPGVIADGDVLSWLPGQGPAAFVLLESQVDALVSHALGVATVTGEVKGLTRDPATGSVLFCVQSPTAHDASVFTTDGGGALWTGHSESDFGFTAAAELDALAITPYRWPATTVTSEHPQPGETIEVQVHDAEPGVPIVLLLALDLGPAQFACDGWGGLVLAPDALFGASLKLLPFRTVVPDAFGQASLGSVIPLGASPVDLYLQGVSLLAPHVAGNPLVVEVAQ